MRKKATTLLMAAVFTAGMSMVAYAGWEQDGTQWKYKNDDGAYSANTWQWIDGNKDGVSECYYFDGNGYMLADTTTPDGYTVNADGQWMSDGVVQIQGTNQTNNTQETYNVADASDMTWSFGGSNENSNSSSVIKDIRNATPLSDEEAYERLMIMKEQHPEGEKEFSCNVMPKWVMGVLYGNEYMSTPPTYELDWDNLHIGDVISYSPENSTSGLHAITVMEIDEDGIKVAESGYGGKVHYGRYISRDEIEDNFLSLISAWSWQ